MSTVAPRTEEWIVNNCNVLYDAANNGALFYHPEMPFRGGQSQPAQWTGYLLTGAQNTASDWAFQDGNTCRGYMNDNGYDVSPDSKIQYYHQKCEWQPLLGAKSALDECKFTHELCTDFPKYPDNCPIDPYSGQISKPCSDFINTFPDPVANPKASTAICRNWWNNYDQSQRNAAIDHMKLKHSNFPEVRDMASNCTSFKTSNNCMIDPATGSKMLECSHLKSSSAEGDNCRTWISGLSQEQTDQVINTICINFPELVECKCVNRIQDPQYVEVKPYAPYPDGCWYVPCAGTEPFWVKSSDNVSAVNCPANICQVIFDASAEGDVNIDENYIYFNCEFDEGEGGETEPPTTEWGTLVTDQQLTRFFVLFFSSIGVLFLSLL